MKPHEHDETFVIRAHDHDGLEVQPIPEKTRCPNCRAKPTEESIIRRRLSANGYLHDDVRFECRECEERWLLGIPIGEGGYDDLYCESCRETYADVHRFQPWDGDEGDYRIHLKCGGCDNFWFVFRDTDENGLVLVGYPHLTGEQDGETLNDGYPDGTLNTDE